MSIKRTGLKTIIGGLGGNDRCRKVSFTKRTLINIIVVIFVT
jgi:hypothetical protein